MSGENYENYDEYKVPDLREMCKTRGIKGYSKKNKEELIKMLQEDDVKDDAKDDVIWKSINNFPNYEINSNGVVRNKKTEKVITPTGRGCTIYFRRENKQEKKSIRLLLLEHFPEKYREREFIDGEEWKVYNDIYEISSIGRVYNYKNKIMLNLKLHNGYYKVSIKRKGVNVHRLVASLFIENPHKYPIVNHKDGNKLNNNVNNLEWCSYKHNSQHAHDSGLVKKTVSAVMQIELKTGKILREFSSITEAEKETNIKSISAVCRGIRNKAGGYGWKYKEEKDKSVNIIEGEIWKKYSNTEYYVSSLGRIKNKNNEIRKLIEGKDGYMYIGLSINKKQQSFVVHRLVAETFLDNPNNLPQVNHKDRNKTNNSFTNLEWISHIDNCRHASAKKIFQINLDDGTIVKEFNSISEAVESTGISDCNISSVLTNNQRTAGNFIWRYTDSYNAEEIKEIIEKIKEIITPEKMAKLCVQYAEEHKKHPPNTRSGEGEYGGVPLKKLGNFWTSVKKGQNKKVYDEIMSKNEVLKANYEQIQKKREEKKKYS